jgi:hypothetical protein
MDWKDRVDFGELVRRFDRGERGTDLLAQLNRAAYDCFHAPWETLPAPKTLRPSEDLPVDLGMSFLSPETPSTEIGPLRKTQGRLPIEDEDEDEGLPSALTPQQRKASNDPPDSPGESPEQEAPQDQLQNPLALLAAALETMGHRGYLSGETRLLVELPYDPKTDSLGWMTFLADHGKSQILVMSQSDLAVGRVSAADLERHCRNYNRRNTGMKAGLFKPQEGARPRLRLTATISFTQITPLPILAESLSRLLMLDLQFWSHVRKCLPI